MVIGVDFDNTIVSYDRLFEQLARERGLNVPSGKKAIRDQIRLLPEGEIEWQKLQGMAYGPRIQEAEIVPGVEEFFDACHQHDIPIVIISHKTEFAGYDETRTNLREAARAWLKEHGLGNETVYFAGTRAEKIALIKRLDCTVFVDDLEETFCEPDFPPGVEKILFAPHGHAPVPGVTICPTWQEIRERVFFSHLLGRAVKTMEWIGGGGNSRIYKLDGPYAGKVYFDRKRLETEFAALQFCWEHGIRCVPQPIGADPMANLAVYEFIAGEKPSPTESDILAAVEFLDTLKHLSVHGAHLPLAAEACFSIHEIIANIDARLARLAVVPALQEFLTREFVPLLDRFRSLPDSVAEERQLSPSDFGFHNALRRPDGQLVFLDFEYFGWDDPAKMVCDFLLHPAMNLSENLRGLFYRHFAKNKKLAKRVETVYPLFGLKWITILLNEFLPEDLRRRGFASGGTLDRAAVQARQLEKARRMLDRVRRDYEMFPFRNYT